MSGRGDCSCLPLPQPCPGVPLTRRGVYRTKTPRGNLSQHFGQREQEAQRNRALDCDHPQ